MITISNSLLRIPAAFLLLTLITSTDSHALPRQTKTVAYRELDVQPWPLATSIPDAHDLLRRQEQLNTICGYIGGNPQLPATCSAGSHCVVDVEHKAVGCCPDGVPCTMGIYTGCVDRSSGPQTEINPYIYTCGGKDWCYQNAYPGGFFQYGCGASTGVAGTVLPSAPGRKALDVPTVVVALTAVPSTIGQQETTANINTIPTASADTPPTSTHTSDHSDKSGTKGSSGQDKGGNEGGVKSSAGGDAAQEKDSGTPTVGVIVGGALGGVAALLILIALVICAKRRSKNKANKASRTPPPQPVVQEKKKKTQRPVSIVRPIRDDLGQFETLPSTQVVNNTRNLMKHKPPPLEDTDDYLPRPSYGGSGFNGDSPTVGRVPAFTKEEREPLSPFNHHPPSSIYSMPHNVGLALGGAGLVEDDQAPLTRESEDFGNGYIGGLSGLNPISERSDGSSPSQRSPSMDSLERPPRIQDDNDSQRPVSGSSSPYTPRRAGGGGAFWAQNRDPSSRPGSGWL